MDKEIIEDHDDLDEIQEEEEILAELKEEEKIRKKNAKTISLALFGLLICGAVFFWTQQKPSSVDTGKSPSAPKLDEAFPQVGKLKAPGKDVRNMEPLEEPLASDEDAAPPHVKPVVEAPEPIARPSIKPVVKASESLAQPKKTITQTPSRPKEELREKIVNEEKKDTLRQRVHKIRIGSFVLESELRQAISRTRSLGLTTSTEKKKDWINMHKTLVGPFQARSKAVSIQNRLKISNIDGFILQKNGEYYVHVGAFYKREGAIVMRGRIERMEYPFKLLYEPAELQCHVLYASFKGTLDAAKNKEVLLRRKGFKDAEVMY